MSEATETKENNIEEGVERMSLSDALGYASGEPKQVEETPEQPEEIENEKVEAEETPDVEVEAETPEVETVEDAKADVVEPIAEKEVKKDPYDGIDEEDRDYFDFKRRNKGTTRADYEDSLVDYNKFDKKELLRRKLREQYNITDSDQELDEYIEGEHGIPMDIDEAEMSLTERVRLRNLTDDYIASKKEQHAKWAEGKVDEKVAQVEQKEEMITLADGTEMPKAKYDNIVEARNTYVKNNEEALNRVEETSFTFTADDNGEKRELNYSYKFDKEDKHRMQSITTDAVKHFNDTYQTEKGVNHESMNENKAWEDPQIRGKMLSSLAQSIRAEAIEEYLQERGNVSLGSNKNLQKQDPKGYKVVPLSELLNN